MQTDLDDGRFLFDPDSSSSIAVITNPQFPLGTKAGLEVKARFGGIDWLRNQNPTPGSMIAVRQHRYNDPNAAFYVYYLITRKGSVTGTSELENIASALNAMRTHAQANGVTEIRMAFENQRYSNAALKAEIDTVFNSSGVTVSIINATCRASGGC